MKTEIESIIPNTSVKISIEKDNKEYKNKYISPDPTILKDFVNELLQNNLDINTKKIDALVHNIKRKYKIAPSKPDIRSCYEEHFSSINIPINFKHWMIKRAVRSHSGVLVVTVVLSPHVFSCKYNCSYCPKETDLSGNPTQPRSYLSNEPAMLRALQYDFDVKGQFHDRIRSYYHTGNIDSADKNSKKMEIILSGGTWESYPLEYREQVMLELYWAANT